MAHLQQTEVASWSTRIPAAIARAKEFVGDASWRETQPPSPTVKIITREEVALAEALWETWAMHKDCDDSCVEAVPDPALIAFTTKVESLG
jgi:hypothetical protein